ncbi:aspartic peptidase domain-containing protein [Pholiota molesta]|nr:aspartic peptidase domain-containing protein [Pholiota molesta]
MFSFSYLLLFFILLIIKNPLLAIALPSISRTSLVSIPLSRPTYTSGLGAYTHGSIVQQQHTNRGIKRLSSMTGRTVPSDYELLSKVWQRITLLPTAQQRPYRTKDIAAVLSQRNISASKPGLEATLKTSRTPRFRRHKILEDRNSTVSKSALHTIGLSIESNDVGYIGQVKIGTPPKNFRLLVDSGSADLWVGAVGCRSDAGGNWNHTFLGRHTSSSFNQSNEDWAIGYVSGSVWGYLAQDVVSIADLTMKNIHLVWLTMKVQTSQEMISHSMDSLV